MKLIGYVISANEGELFISRKDNGDLCIDVTRPIIFKEESFANIAIEDISNNATLPKDFAKENFTVEPMFVG